MSCFHPLKGFKIGYHSSGKPNYKITSYDCVGVKFENGVWKECYDKLKTDFLYPMVTESIDIPCGHCIGCYLDRSRQWADRCMLEASYHESSCFITLTINDEHLLTDKPIYHGDLVWYPIENNNYDYDGCILDKKYTSLRKSDFQKFMKRLRKRLSNDDIKVRYFGCSEYGSESLRPHYHAIIFGYDFPDKVFLKNNFNGDKLFISPMLSELWPFGFSTVAECNWNTCAYVSRYCLKKSDNDLSDFYKYCECEKESVFMSRKPGIARQYYDDHFDDIYRFEKIVIPDSNGKVVRPPRYFDRLYDIDYPSDMERIKEKRRVASIRSKEDILSNTDLDYLDYLKVKEYNLHSRSKLLHERSDI